MQLQAEKTDCPQEMDSSLGTWTLNIPVQQFGLTPAVAAWHQATTAAILQLNSFNF